MNESENLMKGSVHDDYFYIFRDALVLMTSKETINWIKYNGYLPIWLLTLNVLQDVTHYTVRPVVNTPISCL